MKISDILTEKCTRRFKINNSPSHLISVSKIIILQNNGFAIFIKMSAEGYTRILLVD